MPIDIFGTFPDEGVGSAPITDPHFVRLARDKSPVGDRVRVQLNRMISRYPEQHREALIGRLKDADKHHESALFELICHEILIQHGHEILDIEPSISEKTTKKRPDFLVRSCQGDEFYLEAKVKRGISSDRQAELLRLNDVANAVNAVQSSDYLLCVDVHSAPTEAIAIKKLTRNLRAWLELAQSRDTEPKDNEPFVFDESGADIKISAIPKHLPSIQDRTIGLWVPSEDSRNTRLDTQKALRSKASRYGPLERPYVVAINLGIPFALPCDPMFTSKRQYKTVSGVLLMNGLGSWDLGSMKTGFFVNPWAKQPFETQPFKFDVYSDPRQDGKLIHQPGIDMREVLSLPLGWPIDHPS